MIQERPDVTRRRLGRTELCVSEIGLGGAWLQGRRQERTLEQGAEVVRHALARGINYLDTAECYGESEQIFGIALEDYAGEYLLATKFGHVPQDFDFSRQSVLESVQRSLKRLRRSRFDLLQLHTPAVPEWKLLLGPNGALEGMREARDRGWCRFLGTTGNDVEFLRRCLETEFFDTMLIFLRYDLLDQSGEALIREAHAQDVGVILGSPLRMGLFGQARAESLRGLTEPQKEQMNRLEALFANQPGGVTAGAIRFALGCVEASMILSGASTVEELDAVLKAATVPLLPEAEGAVRGIARGRE